MVGVHATQAKNQEQRGHTARRQLPSCVLRTAHEAHIHHGRQVRNELQELGALQVVALQSVAPREDQVESDRDRGREREHRRKREEGIYSTAELQTEPAARNAAVAAAELIDAWLTSSPPQLALAPWPPRERGEKREFLGRPPRDSSQKGSTGTENG